MKNKDLFRLGHICDSIAKIEHIARMLQKIIEDIENTCTT